VTDIKAADLPEGSVVADDGIALFRLISGAGFVWRGTDGKRYRDEDVDELLVTGAFVLREGLR
jgi:hypothetical protein